MDGIPSPPSGLGDDPISAIIAIVFLIIAIPFLVLGLIALVELLLVRKGPSVEWDEPAGDWQASGLRIHEVAEALRRGTGPPAREVSGS